jgi:hypothetical protein
MKKEWYNKLPWAGLAAGSLMVILLVLAAVLKPSVNIESPVNREMVTRKLNEVKIGSKEEFNSSAFIEGLNRTLDDPVINTRWLISNDGLVIYANGMMAASTPLNASIYNLIDNQNRGLINAIEGNMDMVQKKILYSAAAIRKEGDHNDVNGHIVVPLKTSTDELAGFIGVAFNLDDPAQPAMIYIIDIALIICFLFYWLSFPLWVYFDCRRKDNKYIFWTLFVLIGNLPAYIAYFISKKQSAQ